MSTKTMFVACTVDAPVVRSLFPGAELFGLHIVTQEWADKMNDWRFFEGLNEIQVKPGAVWALYEMPDPDFIKGCDVWAEDVWALLDGFAV